MLEKRATVDVWGPAELADELGYVRAKIAELRAQERVLVAEFLATEEDASEGDLFRAKRVKQERRTVAWEKIARDLGASDQRIRANTKILHSTSVRTYGRKT